VLASQRRLEVVDDLAAHEPVPELVEAVAIDVKFGEPVADVFIGGIAEQSKLGRVRPQDSPLGADLLEAFNRVFEEIRKLLLTKMKRLLRLLAPGFLGFERPGLMLQQTYRAKAFGWRR